MKSIGRLWNRDFPIRTRVIALIAVLLFPMLGLFAWMAANYASAEMRNIEARRFDAVTNLTYLIDGEISRIIGALNGLAVSPALDRGDLVEFRSHAEAVAKLSSMGAIVVYDPSGQQLLSTALPQTESLPIREDRRPIAGALEGKAVVSQVVRGLRSNQPIVIVSVPIYKDGKVAYALSGSISPSRFQNFFQEAGINGKWVSAIVDRTGRFVARNIKPNERVGEPARPELVKVASGTEQIGEFENITLEGLATANSFRRSSVSDWTSVVAVPKVELMAPARQARWFLAIGGLTISLLSFGAAWTMANRISDPVRKLSDASIALVEGRPLPLVPDRITELREVRAAFEHAGAKLAHLAAIVASSGDAIISVGLDGKILSWIPGAERLFGYTANEIIGQPKTTIIPDNLTNEAEAHLKRSVNGERFRVETKRRRKDGSEVDVSLDLAPINDQSGKITGMLTIAHDISERKSTEEHQVFLMREITHRSKNLLAVISAMARQTVRSAGTLPEFENRFSLRLAGLAASHDLLVSQNWATASIKDLFHRQLDVFADGNERRLETSGPEVLIDVEAAQAIGLAFHELATNSLKYGALSQPTGKIILQWRFEQTEGQSEIVCLTWTERGGPPVVEPKRTGFGRFVTESMVAQSLGGTVAVAFAPDGFAWTLKFPKSHLVKQNERTGGRRAKRNQTT